MAVQNSPSQVRAGYAVKFGLGVVLLFLLVAAASVNTYVDVLSQTDNQAVQQTVLSGLITILLAFVVAVSFITATIGRESLSSLTVLTERARQMERGDLDVELQTNKTDELGDLYRSFASMRDALRARIQQAEDQNRRLQARANEYSTVMQAAADGDLTARMDPDEEIDAMAEIAGSFNAMMDELEATVVQVQAFATEVNRATDELARQADQSREAASLINEVAGAVESEADELAQAIESAEDGDRPEVMELASAAGTETDLETVSNGGGDLEDTLRSLAELSARIERIDEVSEFIGDVAAETNVLALNASIEASKVDEGAEGFQVVADEVKALAEETQASVDEIETIMNGVRGGTTRTIEDLVRQQATTLEGIETQANELTQASNELRKTLAGLNVSQSVSTTVQAGNVDESQVVDIDR